MTKDSWYIMGIAMHSAVVQAAKNASELSKVLLIPAHMKAGLESLKNFGADELMDPVTVTASDHGSGGKTRIDTWGGKK